MSDLSFSDQEKDIAFFLKNVSVEYRLPDEKISTFKEYAIRFLQGRINYNSFLALDKVSLSVKQGEIFGIMGKNGAGKSTMLKVLSRVLYPTEGRVWIKGKVYPLLQLGAGFHPELTGFENAYLNGTLLGHTRDEITAKLPEIIDFSEIGGFMDAPLRTYSSGMMARLGFSIATAWIPDILVLDEILAVGDKVFVEKCFDRMKVLRESGATVVLVSHSIKRIVSMCQRAALLDQGKIVIVGEANEVAQFYEKNM